METLCLTPGHVTDVTEGLSQLLHSHGLTAEGLRGALQAEFGFGVWKNQAVAPWDFTSGYLLTNVAHRPRCSPDCNIEDAVLSNVIRHM